MARKKKLREAGKEKETDSWVNLNENLFKTELTAGDAICWRILKWFIDGEENDDDYLVGRGREVTDPKKQAIVKQILEL